MAYVKGRHPGAVWRKTDLQVHTPRDHDWLGSPNLAGGSPEAENARKQWADGFVAECLKRGLSAIAITDHHDIVMYPYVADAIGRLGAESAQLWLFPGMEVTCEDSVQCLVLFDQGTPASLMQRLFGLMPKIPQPQADAAAAPQAGLCGKNIGDFLDATFEDTTFRGKIVVLPHASKAGHKDILRRGFHTRFAELEIDGVYNEKLYTALDKPTLDKIYGATKDWGDRRHGIITTGDNRSAAYERLGAHPCWVRLGEPTAELIRQALLADEARITYTPPAIPAQRVLEVRVHSTLTGPDFALNFNDGFNALIGGRGSGKSAVLEYLRFALGRSTIDTDEDDDSDRERDLIRSTLAGGFVEVDLERDGVRETWRRSLDKQAFITIRSAAGETIELPIAAAHERFRARAFSQKQLSTLVRRTQSADEQITGIAAAESVDQRRQIEERIATREREIRTAFQDVVQGWAAEAAHGRAVAILEDLKRRIEATRLRLEQGGLSPEQQQILDQHPVYGRTELQFAAAIKAIDERVKAADLIVEFNMGAWTGTVEAVPVEEAKVAMTAANAAITRARDGLKADLQVARVAIAEKHTAFKILHAEYLKSYETASAAQASLGTMLSDYRRLSAELEQTERSAARLEEEKRRFADADAGLTAKRVSLVEELTALRQTLNQASERVEAMSSGTLRARVGEEKAPQRFKEALVELCERCAIRELDQRCAARVEELSANGAAGWDALLQKLQSIRRALVLAGEKAELDPALIADIRDALGWDLTENQSKAVLARLDDARLGQLLSVWAAPFVRFEYRDRGTYMAFERASPGQQASALLTLLLNQEAGTLIIDQPEDDLDNRVIMVIVKLLQTTKRRRQLIFATHNPNFVVNGDADKVVALAPNVEPSAPDAARAAQIEIETDGAIETISVRKAITDTMEGGQDAFELRGRKYAFEAAASTAGAAKAAKIKSGAAMSAQGEGISEPH